MDKLKIYRDNFLNVLKFICARNVHIYIFNINLIYIFNICMLKCVFKSRTWPFY